MRLAAAARRSAADLFKCKESEIIFTSGGTEANNLAIYGLAYQYKKDHKRKAGHIIASAIEHRSILRALELFESDGGSYTLVEPDATGRIRPEAVERVVRKDTFLVSVMMANNEIGTIEPIREIGFLAHKNGCLFHTDAVQAAGHIPISMAEGIIDLMSASAHKMYGPKGIGLLYVREGIEIQPLLVGGMQERGRRAGTENIFSKALNVEIYKPNISNISSSIFNKSFSILKP